MCCPQLKDIQLIFKGKKLKHIRIDLQNHNFFLDIFIECLSRWLTNLSDVRLKLICIHDYFAQQFINKTLEKLKTKKPNNVISLVLSEQKFIITHVENEQHPSPIKLKESLQMFHTCSQRGSRIVYPHYRDSLDFWNAIATKLIFIMCITKSQSIPVMYEGNENRLNV